MSPSELAARVEAARQHVKNDWSPQRALAAEHGMRQKRRRRTVVRTGLAVVLLAAAGLATALALRTTATAPVQPLEQLAAVSVEPVDDRARFRLGEPAELLAGSAHITVAKRGRPARLIAGFVEVEAVDARFLLERDERVHVLVEEGTAVVRWPGGEAQLTAGKEGWFPPAPAAVKPEPEPEPDAEPSEAPGTVAPSPLRRRPVQHHKWKALAESGDYPGAFVELKKAPTLRDEPSELMLAADVARLSHHPADALAPLQQLLQRHAGDPHAPLAAFTLGRVLIDELGRPQEAAVAFARARSLAPAGPLADDALAREVEARSRSGEPALARTLAEEYLRRQPDGPRARMVRHWGGLE